jgi:hypothetical protein
MLDEEPIQELDRDVAEQFFIHNRSMYLLYKINPYSSNAKLTNYFCFEKG